MTQEARVNILLGVVAAIFAAAVVCGFYTYDGVELKESLVEVGKAIKDIIQQVQEYQPSE